MAATEMLYCPKCNKTMAATNFYTYKDKTKAEYCKPCLTMHINNWEEDTFLWLLEKFDVPYIKAEWDVLRDRAYAKDPLKMNGMSVFGKYLSKMKLNQYNKYTWADTEMLAKKAEENAEKYANVNAKSDEDIENMRIAYENGEISEAQFLTYQAQKKPEIGVYDPTKAPVAAFGQARQTPPVPERQYEDVDLPDISKELTDEDKLYLATKWGTTYTAIEWISLEKLYKEFIESFDIQGAARIDTLKMICKTSLKMNSAIDCGDIDSYQKLSKVYDALMKSAKFTEAQRKEEKSGDFDSVGQIVYFAEKVGGRIPRKDISKCYDLVDEKMENMKRYTRELFMNDPTLAQEIENFMQRKINIEEQKNDMKAATAAGQDRVMISDKDFKDFNDFIEKQEDNNES